MDRKIKSFAVCINHAEAVACLDDAMAGRLFKALFDYASNGNAPTWNDKALTAVFKMFKSQIDKNVEAYQEKCEKNAINARKRYAAANIKAYTGNGSVPSHTTASQRNETITAASGSIPNGDNHNNNNKKDTDKKEEKNIKEETVINEYAETIAPADSVFLPKNDELLGNNSSFELIWAMYGKPIGNKTELEKQWNGLSDEERKAILAYVPRYVAARPDPKYRKNFCNFLASRTWETEPITPMTYAKYRQRTDTISKTKECARDNAACLTEELIAKCDVGSEEKA